MALQTLRLPGFIFLTLVLSVATVQAQDPVFSQYTAAPVYTNPALVGLFEGELRFTANYRDQWASVLGTEPLRTYAAAGELRYAMGGRDYLAVAVNALRDEGGESRYTITRAGFGVTMQKYLDGGRGRDATYLGFGARVGYGQNSFDPNALWFTSNFDSLTVSINPDGSALPVGYVGSTLGYLDVAGGINLAVVRRDYSFFAGIAAHHLNSPNTSFVFDATETLAPRYSAMIGGEYLIQDNLRLMPSAIYERQAKSQRTTVGSAIYYRPDERGDGDAGFRVGIYGRAANAYESGLYFESLILAGQLEYKAMTVGLSYDINMGALGRATDGRGAFELSLSWIRQGRSRYKVVCPKL